jgi:hypothetical protein
MVPALALALSLGAFLPPTDYLPDAGVDGGQRGTLVMGSDGQHLRPLTVTDEGVVRTVSEPIVFYVSRDSVWEGKGAHNVNVLGRRDQGWGSTSTLGDVCQYLDTSQQLINAVSGATPYWLVSSSVNDTAAGTGAQTVRIVYLPSDGGAEATKDVTMNGTTGVFLDGGYDFFQYMEVATVGSNEVSVGNLTISTVSGAPTVAQTVEQITAGGNRSMCGRYKVPPDSTGYLLDWHGSAIGNDLDMRLRVQEFSDNGHVYTPVYHFFSTNYVVGNTTNFVQDMLYEKAPAGAIVKVSSKPTAAGAANRADSNFHLLVKKN